MENITDKMLIERYLAWCIANDFNQNQMAEVARRTKAWASYLVKGKITRLQFNTRNRIKAILGIQ